MRHGLRISLVVAAILASGMAIVAKLRTGGERHQGGPKPKFSEKLAPYSPSSAATPPRKDADIDSFSKSLSEKELDELAVIGILKSDISQHKKSVALTHYRKNKGGFLSREWSPLLISLICNADEWPNLANSGGYALELLNRSGAYDEEIADAYLSLPEGEVIKRSSLAMAVKTRPVLERLIEETKGQVEAETLAERHAATLNQSERLEQFRSQINPAIRANYLKSYIIRAQSKEELVAGVTLGTQDDKLPSNQRSSFIFAASQAELNGKSEVIFDYWKSLLKDRDQEDYISLVTIAIPPSAYSESSEDQVKKILDWLMMQTFDSKKAVEPVTDLAIAMVNACADSLIDHRHCPVLDPMNEKLRARLRADGLGGYID